MKERIRAVRASLIRFYARRPRTTIAGLLLAIAAGVASLRAIIKKRRMPRSRR